MQAQRFVGTVGEDGFVRFHTNQPKGARVDVIVVPLDEVVPGARNISTMRAQGGFVEEVLGSAAEDVWNDL